MPSRLHAMETHQQNPLIPEKPTQGGIMSEELPERTGTDTVAINRKKSGFKLTENKLGLNATMKGKK